MTRADSALFTAIYYGFVLSPSHLPERAMREDYNNDGSRVTEEECRVALINCLAKGWLQIIDETERKRIADRLQKDNVLGPIYGGLPNVGGIDFTDAGAELWDRLCQQLQPKKGMAFPYTDVVHEKSVHYFRTLEVAIAAMEEIRSWDDVIAVNGPLPIGPWRAQWWRQFPEGYRIDVEQRRQWWGRADSGNESCYLDLSKRNIDSKKLQHILNCHNVTLAEWLMMVNMEPDWNMDSDCLSEKASEFGNRVLSVTISEEQCREGLEACLRNGWLRVVDQQTTNEVRLLLKEDPVHLAVPRTAESRPRECCYQIKSLEPGQIVLVPVPATHRLGKIDFTPTGAELYRMISDEWLGSDWENDLSVNREYYWEVHYYCESEERLELVVQEHVVKGDVVRASRMVPIGPWCVNWWQRFPKGYRLELDLGDT
ncbi:MAG TPA: hypothetical protein VG097_04975 [Gemmata sp.]|nr:hypothetical protein [Gemmata sp.]